MALQNAVDGAAIGSYCEEKVSKEGIERYVLIVLLWHSCID